jgi:hypothetical protein
VNRDDRPYLFLMSSGQQRPSVSIAIRSAFLRNFLREDLESNGFDVISATSSPGIDPADVVVTNVPGTLAGRYATVRVDDLIEVILPGQTMTYPIEAIDHLCDILHAESNGRAS